MIVSLILVAALAQQPAGPAKPADVTLMKAALGGSCSADFTVKDADGKPVYAAMVHVRIRYGFAGVKHADLEVGTSSDGKARVEGLPDKARLMTWDIKKDEKKTEVTQDVASTCHATFDVALK
jgi:hypothetical protein